MLHRIELTAVPVLWNHAGQDNPSTEPKTCSQRCESCGAAVKKNCTNHVGRFNRFEVQRSSTATVEALKMALVRPEKDMQVSLLGPGDPIDQP